MAAAPTTIDEVEARLRERRYIGDRGLATSIFLALKLEKPLLIEGEAGVGKTEVAKVMADVLGARLIRLQCYEGIDLAPPFTSGTNRAKCCTSGCSRKEAGRLTAGRNELFSPEFLLKRPLLAGHRRPTRPAVLLIDEIDRADEEFEAFLLELLSDFQVTIPEIGTSRPRCRRCHHHLEPHARAPRRAEAALPLPLDRLSGLERELEIVRRAPRRSSEALAREVVGARPRLREWISTRARRGRDARLGALAGGAGATRIDGSWSTRPSARSSSTTKTEAHPRAGPRDGREGEEAPKSTTPPPRLRWTSPRSGEDTGGQVRSTTSCLAWVRSRGSFTTRAWRRAPAG